VTSSGASRDIFATTRWTVVLAAGLRQTPQSDHALEELCRIYWFPLYAYVRRRGHAKADAEDLVQEFFARFLARNYLEGLSAGRGRFRAFLLASLKNFLANEWKKSRRLKRGGGEILLSLDWESADARFQVATTAEPSPDQAFDREWAVALLSRVLERLGTEYADKARYFEVLQPFLTAGKGTVSHADAGKALGMDDGAVRVAVHRMRKRYRQLLRDEISQTLTDPAMLENEMQALFGAFR
jgi:RNA polymerase sigma-70 factor (ECF subfamily)